MSEAEAITTLIASVFAIIGGIIVSARYLARRIDKWLDIVVESSTAIRRLTLRVESLERTMQNGSR